MTLAVSGISYPCHHLSVCRRSSPANAQEPTEEVYIHGFSYDLCWLFPFPPKLCIFIYNLIYNHLVKLVTRCCCYITGIGLEINEKIMLTVCRCPYDQRQWGGWFWGCIRIWRGWFRDVWNGLLNLSEITHEYVVHRKCSMMLDWNSYSSSSYCTKFQEHLSKACCYWRLLTVPENSENEADALLHFTAEFSSRWATVRVKKKVVKT